MRRTKAQLRIAAALLNDPDGHHYGYPLGKVTGVRSGVLYPTLTRWLDAGLLADGWEEGHDPATAGRPARRYYTLTDEGRRYLIAYLEGESKDLVLDMPWVGL